MWNHIQGVDFVVLGYIALHGVRNRQSVSQQRRQATLNQK